MLCKIYKIFEGIINYFLFQIKFTNMEKSFHNFTIGLDYVKLKFLINIVCREIKFSEYKYNIIARLEQLEWQ